MSLLSISLLGGFEVTLNGKPVTAFGTNKVRGLLAFLAVNSARPCLRTELASMLWPDLPEKKAAHNLSQTLLRLRRTLLEDPAFAHSFLLITSQDIQFNPRSNFQLDIIRFRELIEARRRHTHPNAETCPICMEWLRQAMNLYRGNVLAGFFLRDSVTFEEWRLVLQETLHGQAMEALARLAVYHEQLGEYKQAGDYARRQVILDSWHEPAHLQLMRMLALEGQPAAALKAYQAYRRAMVKELGIEPSVEATLLYKKIRSGEFQKSETSPVESQKAEAVWVSQEGERRQITALICGRTDAVIPDDPEDIHEQSTLCARHCEHVLSRFGGYRAMRQGINCLVYFGYPQAYEDAARRAVYAGLAMAATQKDSNPVSVGIHTGIILVHEQNGSVRQPRDLIGNVPDLARKSQRQAEPGTVLVTADTERLVRNWFDCRALESHTSAESAHPIKLFQVYRESKDRSRYQTDFVGRKSEVAQLLMCQHVSQQNHGQIIQLTGEPGIGKSRLVWEFRHKLFADLPQATEAEKRSSPGIQAQQILWLEDHCLPHLQNTHLHPLINLLKQLLGFEPGDSPEAQKNKLTDTLTRFELAGPATVWLLSLLLGLPTDTSTPQTITPEQHERMREVFVSLLQKQAVRQPLVLVIEDLHWSDPTTVEWLGRSFDALADIPCLILLTFRPVFKPSWLPRTNTLSLNLGRLTPAQSEQMVSYLVKEGVLSEEICRRIADQADGIPLFVEELTKTTLEETETVGYLNGRPKIPATLRDSLMARLDHLGTAKETAQWAAVMGREFSYSVLYTATGLDEPRLQRDLARLVEAELIFSHGQTSRPQYEFSHALFKETAYATLPKRIRYRYHQKIAETLETHFPRMVETMPEILAQHYTRAGSAIQAADYWLLAGERAIAQGATTEARIFFDNALKLIDRADHDRCWRALCGRETVLDMQGDRAAQEADLTALLNLAETVDDNTRRAKVYLRQTAFSGMQGDYRATISLADAACTAARRAGNLTLALNALAYKAQSLVFFGEMNTAQEVVEEALAQISAIADNGIKAQVLTVAAHYYLEAGDLVRSVQLQSESVEAARQAGKHNLELTINANLGLIYAQLGLFTQARTTLESGLARAEALGDRRLYASTVRHLGYVCWSTGHSELAQQLEEQALTELAAIGDAYGEAACRAYLGYIFEDTGDLAQAAHYLALACTGFVDIGMYPDRFEAQAVAARVALAQGHIEEAEQSAREVWAYLGKHGTEGMELPSFAFVCIADVFSAVGQVELSRQVIETGYGELIQSADKISNAKWRRSFLENVAGNKAITEQWGKSE